MVDAQPIEGYRVPSGCCDELLERDGAPRPHAAPLLRHHGIAARYVSGYLFTTGTASSQESVEVDTHAWLEALLPVPGGGEPMWVGADPTNRGLAGENHVNGFSISVR